MMNNLWKLVDKTQRGKILEHMLMHNNRIEVYRLMTPKPMGGLGIAQYNARIKELREQVESLGYEIRNEAGKYFELREINDQFNLI